MTLETLFLIVMAGGLVLPVLAVVTGLSLEFLSDPTRGQKARMSETAVARLVAEHEKKSFIRRLLMF